MRKTVGRIALLLSLPVLVAFVLFLINQTAQIVELAERVHPTLADGVFWGLPSLYAFCLFVPVFLILRLPSALVPPASEDGEAFQAHLRRLGRRLERNPHLAGRTISTKEEVEAALQALDDKADEVTKQMASQVFLTTAISQSGALDAVVVLAGQSKLVLQVARTYYQRPTLRDLLYLYANVATTAYISSELDEVDLSDRIQPVLSAVLGSAAGAVPGFQIASSLVVNSVMTGSANAFLLLRTGMITKQYCGALVRPQKSSVRRSATLQATRMLGAIVVDGAGAVGGAIWKGSAGAVGRTVAGVGTSIRSAGSAVVEKVRPGKKVVVPAETPEP